MTVNHIVGLSNAGANVGNSFTFIFDVGISDAGFSLTINTGFTNAGSPGTVVRTFTIEDMDFPFLTGKNVAFKCTYNGTDWEVYQVEGDENKLGDIKMVSEVSTSDFPSGLATLGTKHQGWALCNGSNSTVDLRERFIAASNYGNSRDGVIGTSSSADYDTSKIGSTSGGSHSYKLSGAQSGIGVHSHNHTLGTDTEADHVHSGGPLTATSGASSAHTHYSRQTTAIGAQGSALKVGNVDAADDGSGGRYAMTSTASSSYDGRHSHSISGNTGPKGGHSHAITTGSITASAAASAAEEQENRPSFVVLGFIQRVKQS